MSFPPKRGRSWELQDKDVDDDGDDNNTPRPSFTPALSHSTIASPIIIIIVSSFRYKYNCKRSTIGIRGKAGQRVLHQALIEILRKSYCGYCWMVVVVDMIWLVEGTELINRKLIKQPTNTAIQLTIHWTLIVCFRTTVIDWKELKTTLGTIS